MFAVARWNIREDARLRKLANNRWLIRGRLKLSVLDGSETKEAWIERYVRRQPWLLKWIYPLFALAWVGFCSTLIVGGLRGA
jgi:hypothetical protein